ncbi:CLUMA_CG017552, isoform A [Clunio marinus]|uniref:CLUMA_CG017552, isoform A n=1 Tax=Clunio marinus TaxID=568069 RepID=A0A1J1IZ73_9DIPT|nr:CLUMA_CG017552, isoform A [Clunio marinus]
MRPKLSGGEKNNSYKVRKHDSAQCLLIIPTINNSPPKILCDLIIIAQQYTFSKQEPIVACSVRLTEDMEEKESKMNRQTSAVVKSIDGSILHRRFKGHQSF